jgi:Protein of unknown function (DUF3563)
MLSMLKTLINRHSAPTQAQRELAYLNASISLMDLERRQREIDLGLLRLKSFAY